MQSRKLVVAGISGTAAAAITGDAVAGLVATGSAANDALQLQADVNRFSTVAASTGAMLPPMNAGDTVVVYNGGANALTVYPATGATVNQAAASYSVSTTNRVGVFIAVNATTIIAFSAA
jgi:hypothetical protein